MLLAVLPVAGMAQSKSVTSFQKKYFDHEDVTHVTIKGPLFGFLASLAEYDDDPDAQAIVLFDKRTRTERVLTLVELAALLRVAMLGEDI